MSLRRKKSLIVERVEDPPTQTAAVYLIAPAVERIRASDREIFLACSRWYSVYFQDSADLVNKSGETLELTGFYIDQ